MSQSLRAKPRGLRDTITMVGGKLHLKLNTGMRPIANKYREGKVKSTLKRARESQKDRETIRRETNAAELALDTECTWSN